MRCREKSEASSMIHRGALSGRVTGSVTSVTSQERRLTFNSPELIQGGTQATPRVKTARISWKSLAQQFRKLVRFHGADLTFTDAAVREIARIALERGTGARGLRSVVEEVLEGVLFDAEPGARYLVTEKTVQGGEAVRQSMSQKKAPLGSHLLRRLASGKNR